MLRISLQLPDGVDNPVECALGPGRVVGLFADLGVGGDFQGFRERELDVGWRFAIAVEEVPDDADFVFILCGDNEEDVVRVWVRDRERWEACWRGWVEPGLGRLQGFEDLGGLLESFDVGPESGFVGVRTRVGGCGGLCGHFQLLGIGVAGMSSTEALPPLLLPGRKYFDDGSNFGRFNSDKVVVVSVNGRLERDCGLLL
jgi:hypothetical protein